MSFRMNKLQWTRRAVLTLAAVCLMMAALTGCLYPKDRLKQNQAAPKEAVRNVQAAVDDYFAQTGVLPIQNSESNVPKYEKYKVNFTTLQAKNLLSSIPPAAFENGGSYYFLIIDEETAPRVKLMDLVTLQKVNDLQSKVNSHLKQTAKVPKGEQKYNGFYSIDYKQLNMKAPDIRSVFSGQTLEALTNEAGVIFVDYGIDIMQLISKKEYTEDELKVDLRELLVDATEYVPVKSPAYHFINGEPVAINP